VAVSFIGGATGVSWENHRPAANHWQTYHIMLYTSHWAGFELTTSVVIATDCINPTTIRLRPRQNYVKYNEIGNSYNNLILFIFLPSTYTDILYIQCSECKMGIFQVYHGENKLYSMKWWWYQLYTRPTHFVGFLNISLKQQSVGIHVTPFTETTVRGYTCHPIHWNNSPWVYMSPHSLK
jgi:hypothetical protein